VSSRRGVEPAQSSCGPIQRNRERVTIFLQRTLYDHTQEGNGKIVLATNDPTVHHWADIFLDVKCQPVPIPTTATMYNSSGASHASSGLAADAVRRALSTTSQKLKVKYTGLNHESECQRNIVDCGIFVILAAQRWLTHGALPTRDDIDAESKRERHQATAKEWRRSPTPINSAKPAKDGVDEHQLMVTAMYRICTRRESDPSDSAAVARGGCQPRRWCGNF
jgi:hypothetical protein